MTLFRPMPLLLVMMAATLPSAGAESDGPQPAPVHVSERASDGGVVSKPANPRMDSAVAQVTAAAAGGSAVGVRAARRLGLEPRGERILVVVRGSDAAIRSVGGQVQQRAGEVADALVPVTALEALAASPGVTRIERPMAPVLDAVPGEGVPASAADIWHGLGFRGAGVKVAVIDGGFAGLAAAQAAGDLPAAVETVNLCVDFNDTDHGTGVAEIVHEMAPEAALLLICIDSFSADLPNALNEVRTRGATVINTSLSRFATGRGDGSGGPGTLDQVHRDARAAGITWVTSSGNYARAHWSGSFVDTNGDGSHNFTPADQGNTFNVSLGAAPCAYLKWDAWPTTNEDFDLLIRESGTHAVVAFSLTDQTSVARAPIEVACLPATAAGTFYVEITRFSATTTPRMDLWVSSTGVIEHYVSPSSVGELASHPDTFSVGARCVHTGETTWYSSQGPTIDGRIDPDIAAPAHVSNTTYGPGTSCSSGFGGTSASSPHVAGAVALFRSRFPSVTSPVDLQARLEQAAIDVPPLGKDTLTGWGALRMPSFVPDLLIGFRGVVAGDGLATVSIPARRASVREGKKRVFDLIVQNDGPLADTLVLTGPRRARGLRATYFGADGSNITAAVTGAGFAVPLAGLGSAVLKVRLKALESGPKRRAILMGLTSSLHPQVVDLARAKLKVRDA